MELTYILWPRARFARYEYARRAARLDFGFQTVAGTLIQRPAGDFQRTRELVEFARSRLRLRLRSSSDGGNPEQ